MRDPFNNELLMDMKTYHIEYELYDDGTVNAYLSYLGNTNVYNSPRSFVYHSSKINFHNASFMKTSASPETFNINGLSRPCGEVGGYDYALNCNSNILTNEEAIIYTQWLSSSVDFVYTE